MNLFSLAGAAAFQLRRFDLAEHYYEEAIEFVPCAGIFTNAWQ